MLSCTKRCGRAGARWFATRDRSTTLRDYLGSLRIRFRSGGRDCRTMLHCARLCGRAGGVVRWFAGHDRLTTLRHKISMLTRPGDCPERSLSRRFRRGGVDSGTMLRCARLCGRAGAAVRFAGHDRLTTLRDYLRRPLGLQFCGSSDEEAS